MQVNSFTGNLFLPRTDFYVAGTGLPLDASFAYNSARDTLNVSFGLGWTFQYHISYANRGSAVDILHADGRVDTYALQNGNYIPPIGVFDRLEQPQTGQFRLTTVDGETWDFADPSHRKVTQMQDRNGNVLTFAYAGSALSGVTDAVGRTLTLSYANGLLQALTFAPTSRTIQYTYNAEQRLHSVEDPTGNRVTYHYFEEGGLKDVLDARGNLFTVNYNASGQVNKICSPVSNMTITYNGSSGKTFVTENDGNQRVVTTYTYDADGRAIAQGVGDISIALIYDEDNNLSGQADANGNVTQFTHDAEGRILTHQDALSHSVAYAYAGPDNQVSAVVDKRGNSTLFGFDGAGNMNAITLPDGSSMGMEYNGQGDLTRYTDGRGNGYTLAYDANGNLSSATYPSGTENYAYSQTGQLLGFTDMNQHTTTYTYDELDRLEKITNPLSETQEYFYDASGNLTRVVDERRVETNYAYSASDQLTQVTTPAGITQYQYDGLGNITQVTDANGHHRTLQYDTQSRIKKTTDGAGFATHFTYDANGNILSRTDGNGDVTTYQYDALNRLIQKSYRGNTDVFEYDAAGNMVSARNNQVSLSFTYDALNRVVTRTVDTWGKTIRYQYDAAGNRTQMIDAEGGVTQYTYDASNRLVVLENPQGQSFSFSYDAGGRLLTQTNSNGTQAEFAYDAADRLLSVAHINPTIDTLVGQAFGYNAKGFRTSMVEAGEGQHVYTYDDADRLTGVSYPGGDQESFTFDGAGNRTGLQGALAGNVAYQYDAGDRLLSAGGTTYLYDGNGNLTLKISSGDSTVYEYDGENRLVGVQLSSGSWIQYAYDALGNRVQSVENGVITRYVHDGVNVLADYNGQNTLQARYTSALLEDTWLGAEIDGQVYTYHRDALSSVKSVTNSSGAEVASYAYDVYGNLTNEQGTLENRIRYTGREYEATTGLYFYRTRYYDPEVGRFLTQDQANIQIDRPNGLNRYSYVEGNPVCFNDPGGNVVPFLIGAFHVANVIRFSPIVIRTAPYVIRGVLAGARIGKTLAIRGTNFVKNTAVQVGNRTVNATRVGLTKLHEASLKASIYVKEVAMPALTRQAREIGSITYNFFKPTPQSFAFGAAFTAVNEIFTYPEINTKPNITK
ncbi:MAG TPA: hypothetical protein DCE41_02935, partial [Cytophagales bacterium]|nr:hypothetical protein [Cytophagales bacterium]